MSSILLRRMSCKMLSKTSPRTLVWNASMKPSTMACKAVTSHMFSTNTDKEGDAHKETKVEAFQHGLKSMWKKYGTVFIGTYLSIYVGTLTGLFLALDHDIFSIASIGLDPNVAVSKACDLFETITGNTELPQYIRDNPRAGTLAIAWMTTKVSEPLRLAVSIGIVPSIARMLGRAPRKEPHEEVEEIKK